MLSDEELEEIRAELECMRVGWYPQACRKLLDEVDALRAEVDRVRGEERAARLLHIAYHDDKQKQIVDLRAENAELTAHGRKEFERGLDIARHKSYRDEHGRYWASVDAIVDEVDKLFAEHLKVVKLEAENAELKRELAALRAQEGVQLWDGDTGDIG